MAATDVFSVTGATISIAATSISASSALPNQTATNSPNVRIFNAGPNTAFIRWGIGAQTALATDTPIPAGAVENFFKGAADTFAAICAATQTATVYVTPGTGI